MSRENQECGSQDNEDEILRILLPQESGYYLDIGAHHSRNCSNTHQFYERGWRGILVEPLIDCWAELLQNRMGDVLLPVAASDVNYEAQLRVQGSISSLEPWWPNSTLRRDTVVTMTIPEILRITRWHGQTIHLCSVDVEGHEKQVLAGNDWNLCRPLVMCVEYLGYSDDGQGKDLSPDWEPILLQNGYELINTTKYNKIYLLSQLIAPGCHFQGDVERARIL